MFFAVPPVKCFLLSRPARAPWLYCRIQPARPSILRRTPPRPRTTRENSSPPRSRLAFFIYNFPAPRPSTSSAIPVPRPSRAIEKNFSPPVATWPHGAKPVIRTSLIQIEMYITFLMNVLKIDDSSNFKKRFFY